MINKNSDKILKNKRQVSVIDEIEMIEIKFTVKQITNLVIQKSL